MVNAKEHLLTKTNNGSGPSQKTNFKRLGKDRAVNLGYAARKLRILTFQMKLCFLAG